MNKSIIALTAAAAGLATCAAQAATPATATMNVTLSVTAGCTVSAPDLTFGSFQGSQTAAPPNASSMLSVTCTNGTPYTVAFASPNDLDATGVNKKMIGAALATNTLAYEIVNASAPTTVYGSDTAHQISATGTGAAQTTAIAAMLTDWSAFKPIDSYSDVVTVSVAY